MSNITINVDRNVSFKDYRNIEGKALKVVPHGIFYTFQGEGPHAGRPCVFTRFAGCNIGAKEDCTWCDTKFNIDEGIEFTPEELLHEVRVKARDSKLIIVTGGEPLLQKTSLELFGNLCLNAGYLIQVETNGYFVDIDTLLGHDIVVSPKIPHNKETYLPFKPSWAERKVHLKYVVSADPASKYHHLPEDILQNADLFDNVYVSAMCVYKRSITPGEVASIWDATLVDQEATAANYRYAADLALKHNLRVSYQTHLFGVKE